MLKIFYLLLPFFFCFRIYSYHEIYHLLKDSKYEDLTGIEKPIRTDGIYVCIRDGKDSITGDKKWLDVRSFVFFDDGMFAELLGENAAARAALTHDRMANYKMLTWIYEEIAKENG